MHAPAFIRTLTRWALAVTLALSAPAAFADKGGNGPPDKPAKAAKHEKADKPPKTDKPGKVDESKAPPGQNAEWKAWQTSKGWKKNGGWPGAAHWKNSRAKDWKSERRTWAQRGGYGGFLLPAAHYNARFGPGHAFVIRDEPKIHGGYPRFRQGGYTFVMVDPYPESWSPVWYRTEPVYVVNEGGYYLVNRKRPATPIAVLVID